MGSGNSKGAGGFRVFRVVRGGPANEAGLEQFFDYIVEVNGVAIESDQQSFAPIVKDQEGKRVKLTVYNCRTQALRDVFVIPRSWNGQGLLGLVVKYDLIENGENQGLRVLEVQPNSPAANAGLIPFKDFMICSGDFLIRDGEDFAELVSRYINKEMPLTVYNTDTESMRDLTVVPHRGWGGEGLLGFATGSGVLHRIPMARTSLAPVEPEPSPTPPVPELLPLEPILRPSESPKRNVSILNLTTSPSSSPVAVQLPPLVQPRVVEQHYIATPMSQLDEENQSEVLKPVQSDAAAFTGATVSENMSVHVQSEMISEEKSIKNMNSELSESASVKAPMNSVEQSVNKVNSELPESASVKAEQESVNRVSPDFSPAVNLVEESGSSRLSESGTEVKPSMCSVEESIEGTFSLESSESELKPPMNSIEESVNDVTPDISESSSEVKPPRNSVEESAHDLSPELSESGSEVKPPMNSVEESAHDVTPEFSESGSELKPPMNSVEGSEQEVVRLPMSTSELLLPINAISVSGKDFSVISSPHTVNSVEQLLGEKAEQLSSEAGSVNIVEESNNNVFSEGVSELKPPMNSIEPSVEDIFGVSSSEGWSEVRLPTSGVMDDGSDYSQSVAEAFGLIPPTTSARRSSDGSAVVVDRVSPDISKLFD